MALAFTVTATDRSTNALRVYGKIVASGSYVAGGDTLSLAGQSQIVSSTVPFFVSVQSQASAGASGFEYRFVPGTTLANGKLQVFGQQPTSATGGVIAMSEVAAGAYPAGVTGDVILAEAVFTFGV